MATIVVDTQYMENYGSAKAPYWKAKGGNSYKITGVPLNIDYEAVVAVAGIGYRNDFAEEYILGWSIQNDGWMSQFEKSQLEYEGKIQFPEPTIEYSELVDQHAE